MAKKKVSKLDKLEQLIESAIHSQWCTVDIDNNFYYSKTKMHIGNSISQYTVTNKPKKNEKGSWNNWSNDAQMDKILVVDDGEELRFFDEKFDEVNSMKISIVEYRV